MRTNIVTPSAAVAASLLLGGLVAGQNVVHQLDGTLPSGFLGSALAVVGDTDGDGFQDYVAGAPNATTSVGVFSGRAVVTSGRDGSVLHELLPASALEAFGQSVSDAGDVNGDGFADVLVGAPSASDPANGLFENGKLYVFSGIDGALLLEVGGFFGNDRLGWSVASPGDVDGDGFSDVAGGAIGRDHPLFFNAGAVQVISGATGQQLYESLGLSADAALGWSLVAAGDVNLDGRVDLFAGAPNHGPGLEGEARLISGANGATLTQLFGDFPGAGFGRSIAAGMDVDGNGLRDLAVGQPDWDLLVQPSLPLEEDVGRVQVFSGLGGALLREFPGASAGDRFGELVENAGDFDQDGWGDVAVGSRNLGASGTVRVLSGLFGNVLEEDVGDAPDDDFPSAMACADLNGGGRTDLVLSSARATTAAGVEAGLVRVHSPRDLFFYVDPAVVVGGDPLTLTTRGATTGSAIGVFVTAVDGVPTLLNGPFGTVGGQGLWVLGATTMPTPIPATVTLRTLALDLFQGFALASNPFDLTIQ